MVLCVGILFLPPLAHAEAENETSIIVATGKDVPTDDHLPEGYRFPENTVIKPSNSELRMGFCCPGREACWL